MLRQNRSIYFWAIKRDFTIPRLTVSSHRLMSNDTKASGTTIDQEEVDKFSRLANHWWDETGEFGPLHTMNDLRIPLVRDALASSSSSGSVCLPLSGVKILDVGCGGGILSEPLARLGAEVTGLDASEENIEVAKRHAALDESISLRLRYECSTVENFSLQEPEKYDGVVASEIIEHVANQPQFVTSCCQLVRPGGSIFLTTINRTWLSYWLAIIAAERILRIVPEGVHDWNKFIPPEDLQCLLQKENFKTVLVRGMTLNPLNLRWSWFSDTSINYAIHAVKTVPPVAHSESVGKEK